MVRFYTLIWGMIWENFFVSQSIFCGGRSFLFLLDGVCFLDMCHKFMYVIIGVFLQSWCEHTHQLPGGEEVLVLSLLSMETSLSMWTSPFCFLMPSESWELEWASFPNHPDVMTKISLHGVPILPFLFGVSQEIIGPAILLLLIDFWFSSPFLVSISQIFHLWDFFLISDATWLVFFFKVESIFKNIFP